jgi:hypothetical protein
MVRLWEERAGWCEMLYCGRGFVRMGWWWLIYGMDDTGFSELGRRGGEMVE